MDNDNEDGSISDYNWGFGSQHFMLQALVASADAALLRRGVVEMINYLVHSEDPDLFVAFDILAQFTATGKWIRTVEVGEPPEDEARNLDPSTRPADAKVTVQAAALAPDDIEDLVRRFAEQLNEMPDAEKDDDGD